MKNKLAKWISGLTLGAVLALGVSGGISEVSEIREANAVSTIEIDFSTVAKAGSSDGEKVSTTKDGITVSSDEGYFTGSQFRIYTSGTLTIKSTVGDILEVGLTLPQDDKVGSFVSSYTDLTCGDTFTVKTTSQGRISKISVKVDGGTGTGGGTETDDGGNTEEPPITPTGDLFFTKVTSVDEISEGSKVVFTAGENDCYVNGTWDTSYLNLVSSDFEGSTLVVDNAKTEIFTVGIESGCYTFALENGKKLGSTTNNTKNDNKMALDSNYKWNISETNSVIHIINNDAKYQGSFTEIRYNSSASRICCYPSGGQADIGVYVLSGETKKVILENTEVFGNKGDSVTLKVRDVKGVDSVSSYAWSIVDGSESLVSMTPSTTDTQVVNLIGEGTAKVQVKVNDEITAVATITIHDWKYDILAGSEYVISSSGGKGLLGLDAAVVSDINSENLVWNFEKAYVGDNTYWLSNNGKYLTFSADANLGGSGNEVRVGANKVSAWAVSKSGDHFMLQTRRSDGKDYNLAVSTGSKWCAFSGNTETLEIFEMGDFVFSEFEVEHEAANTKYYAGNPFYGKNDTSLKINVKYTNGFKKDVTKDITWGTINKDGTVKGTYSVNGQEQYVTLNLNYVYVPIESPITVTGLREMYSVGDSIKKYEIVVKVTYKYNEQEDTVTISSDKYSIDPGIISKNTEKITIIYGDIRQDFPINVSPYSFVETPIISNGDEVVFAASVGNKCYEGSLEPISSGLYDKLYGVEYGNNPVGVSVFKAESAGSKNTFYFKSLDTGLYLSSNTDDCLSTGQPALMKGENGKFNSFFFKPEGASAPLEATGYNSTLTYQGNDEWYAYYQIDGNSYYQLCLAADDDTALLEIDYYENDQDGYDPLSSEMIEYDVYYKSGNILYLINPYVNNGDKTAFTCRYVENEYKTMQWWEITCDKGMVYFETVDFGIGPSAKYANNIMIYRNSDIEAEYTVTKLECSVDDSFLKVKKGNEPSWNNFNVYATYDTGDKLKVEYGAYTVSGFDPNTVGEQTVTLTYGEATTTVKITVTGSIESILITNKEAQLTENIFVDSEPFQIKVNVVAPEGEPLKYSTSDESILSIDQTGLATPHKAGEVTVTVKDYYEIVEATATVVVRPRLTGLFLDKTEATCSVGNTITLTPVFEPVEMTSAVTWSTSDSDIATVSNGVVTGVSEGVVTITATAKSFSATCTVTVTKVGISSITTTDSQVSLEVGKTYTVNYSISPGNASNKQVTITSSDTTKATVQNGVVTALAVGRVYIYITSVEDESMFARITINIIPAQTSGDNTGEETGGETGDNTGDNTGGETDGPTIDTPTGGVKFGCGGSIMTSSIVISLASILGAGLLLSKKKDN